MWYLGKNVINILEEEYWRIPLVERKRGNYYRIGDKIVWKDMVVATVENNDVKLVPWVPFKRKKNDRNIVEDILRTSEDILSKYGV